MTDQLDLRCPHCGGTGIATPVDASSITANTEGRTHRAAHATERAAALRVAPRTGAQRYRVLTAICAAAVQGSTGLTDEEIAATPGIADTAHRTRRNELVMGGWVYDSQTTRPTRGGDPAIVWAPTLQAAVWWHDRIAAA